MKRIILDLISKIGGSYLDKMTTSFVMGEYSNWKEVALEKR